MQFKKFFQPTRHYDQGRLISKFQSWAAHHGRDLRDLEIKGYCASLVLRWGIARLHDLAEVKGKVNREQEFFEKIATINSSSHDAHAADADIIEEMNKLELLQVIVPKKIGILDYSKSAEWFSQMKDPSADDDTDFAVERHDVISGVLCGMQEYIEILQKMVDSNPGKLIFIESHNHATGVFFDAQKKLYHFYDPNHEGDSKTQGRYVCRSINELADSAIKAFKLEDIRLKQIKDSDLRIGMTIQVFSLPGMVVQHKINKEEYFAQLFGARQTTATENLNMLAWDESTTSYYLADRADDKESLDIWIQYAKENLSKEELYNWLNKIRMHYPESISELADNYKREISSLVAKCMKEDPASENFFVNIFMLSSTTCDFFSLISGAKHMREEHRLGHYTDLTMLFSGFFKDDVYTLMVTKLLEALENNDLKEKILVIEELLRTFGNDISPENLSKLVKNILRNKILQNDTAANADIAAIIQAYQTKIPEFEKLLDSLLRYAAQAGNIQAADILFEKIAPTQDKLADMLLSAGTEEFVEHLKIKYVDILSLDSINLEKALTRNSGINLIANLIKNNLYHLIDQDKARRMVEIALEYKNNAAINILVPYLLDVDPFAAKLYAAAKGINYNESALEIFKTFLSNGFDPLHKIDNENLFEIAAKDKNFNLLITLLESSTNAVRRDGLSSAITYIIQHELTMSEIELIKKMFSLTPNLVKFFADKDAVRVKSDDKEINSMIEICALQLKVLLRTSGKAAEINLLLQEFAHIKAQFINRTDPFNNNYAALHLACKNGDIDAVSLLCSKGANIYLKADKGETALGLALIDGNIEIAKFLLEKVKQDKNFDNVKQVIVDSLRKNNSYKVIELLQSQKISLDDMPEKTIIRANYAATNRLLLILEKINHSYNLDNKITMLKEMNMISDPEAIRDNLAAVAGKIATMLEKDGGEARKQRQAVMQRLRQLKDDNHGRQKQGYVQELRRFSQELAATELRQAQNSCS